MTTPPTPRRIGRPRWLDVRVIGGVLLVLASVVIGARVIAATDDSISVWSVTGDLAAGTVLADDDVTVTKVRLDSDSDIYLQPPEKLTGKVLRRPVQAGELLPVSVIEDMEDARVVSISVRPHRIAPGVTHGSPVDLYLTSDGTGFDAERATAELLLEGATVQEVGEQGSGGLGSNLTRLALILEPAQAADLVERLPGAELMVVLRTSEERASGVRGGR